MKIQFRPYREQRKPSCADYSDIQDAIICIKSFFTLLYQYFFRRISLQRGYFSSSPVDRYPVLVWDARGHGKSQPQHEDFTLEDCAADLDAILEAERISQIVLIGQSMGGYIAQRYYWKYPDKVRALVIIGSTSIAMPYSKAQILALKASLPLFNCWPHAHMVKTFAHYTAFKPDVRDYAFITIKKLDRQTFHRIWRAVSATVNERGIPGHKINVPFLLTHGEKDNTGVIRKQAPEWAAYEPQVRYIVIPDAAHNANQDNPAFFNRVLREFLVDLEER